MWADLLLALLLAAIQSRCACLCGVLQECPTVTRSSPAPRASMARSPAPTSPTTTPTMCTAATCSRVRPMSASASCSRSLNWSQEQRQGGCQWQGGHLAVSACIHSHRISNKRTFWGIRGQNVLWLTEGGVGNSTSCYKITSLQQ